MPIALLFIASLFAASCATVKKVSAESPRAGVETTVSSIDKYGNCALSITQDEFTAAGFEPGDIVSVKAGAFAFDAPVCTNYSDVDNGKYLVRLSKGGVSFAINMGNFAKTSGAAVGTPVSVAMKGKGAYLADYKIRQLKKSENRSDYASDEIFANFREVKAGGIASGRLYRSCNPVYGDARAPYAEKLIQANGIKAAVNLADSRESAWKHIDEAPYYKGLRKEAMSFSSTWAFRLPTKILLKNCTTLSSLSAKRKARLTSFTAMKEKIVRAMCALCSKRCAARRSMKSKPIT